MTELAPNLLELVQREARFIAHRMSGDLLADLIGYGHVGLLEAKQRFDPRHGVNFEVFATYRIRGAMFDGLRQSGLANRRDYDRLKALARRHEVMGPPVGNGPEGPTREDDAKVLYSQIARLATMRIVEASVETETQVEQMDERIDLARLREAIARLTEADRLLLQAVYDLDDKGDSGAKLAARLGVARSSVSRRHRRALDRLRRILGTPPDP